MAIAGLLLLVAFILPFSSKKIATNRPLIQAFLFLLIVRQFVSFAQVYYNGLPTVEADPIAFHISSRDDYGPLSREPYGVFLKTIYKTFGASHLLGCEVSQVAFSLGLIAFVELVYLFGLGQHAHKLVLTMGLLPSCLLNTSVTMREPFQVMAFLCLTLGTLSLMRDGFLSFWSFAVPVSMGLLVMLQQGFGLLILVLIPFALITAGLRRPEVLLGGAIVTMATLIFFAGPIWSIMVRHSNVLRNIEKGTGLKYIDGYQESVERGRSDFDTYLDLGSASSTLQTAPIVFVYYLFSPLPWQMHTFRDVYGFGESLIRIVLWGYLVVGLLRPSPTPKSEHLLLFSLYFVVEVMWAVGTANWGTAFRHRVVGYPLLVILGGIGRFGQSATAQQQASVSERSSARSRARASRRKFRPPAEKPSMTVQARPEE